jgi:hypothetical protein
MHKQSILSGFSDYEINSCSHCNKERMKESYYWYKIPASLKLCNEDGDYDELNIYLEVNLIVCCNY